MLLAEKKIGNLRDYPSSHPSIDFIDLAWHELNKRIFRMKTRNKLEIAFRSLNENPNLTEGDIIFLNDEIMIAIAVLPADTIVLTPKNSFELASLCYEIGNKHYPLFYEEDDLLIPFEMPMFKQLMSQGYDCHRSEKKLLNRLRTSVAAHPHQQKTSLFDKIMQLSGNE